MHYGRLVCDGLLRLSSVGDQSSVSNFGVSGSSVLDFGLRLKFSIALYFGLIRSLTSFSVLD